VEKVRRWLEKVHAKRLGQDFDAIVLVIGPEGVGKSTAMLQTTVLHQRTRGLEVDADSVIDRIVWNDRTELKNRLAEGDHRSAVMVHDAARVLHKKQAMHGEQIELEADLLDVRTKNFLMLFGFQYFRVIPSLLVDGRADFALRIPERGRIEGYSRRGIEHRADEGEWPEPALVDSFDSLEGTDLWEAFVETDTAKKNERIAAEEEPDAEDAAWLEKTRAALRACQPWRPDGRPMTQRDAAEIVGMSQTWVNTRVQEFKDGYHRELVEDMPGAPAPRGDQSSLDAKPVDGETPGEA
jgi:energy-coupling factor transporter ATP-binding protein EcfA2